MTFKRDGKKIIFDEIIEDHIIITLCSVMSLAVPTRTLSAFSRKLLRLDRETSLPNNSIYNHALFNTEPLKVVPFEQMTTHDISDTMLLKSIIDLLCFPPPEGINQEFLQRAKNELKEIMLTFINYKTL